ncbi:protein of unknown function [Amycolatopsis xylanica]|uniref:DUF1206 domain-containing protein n=1 Tax=Amycolatopsis xylanica TaxID=589385 RepID=A0A1H3M8T5_9PSEU|nr:DUF1206 domain-containing protein [Amycolatopsis xylanica]SDY72435.1 protein of unknown function [Amycolatopsis xylanica]
MADMASRAEKSDVAQVLGRVGMGCFGFVHLVIAYIAVKVAFGETGQSADQKGALAEVGSSTFGGVLLWALAVGLLAFAGWQGLMVANGYHWVTDKGRQVRKRIGSGVRGVVAVGIGISAVQLAIGSGSSSSTGQSQGLTAKVLSWSAGPFLVVLAGGVVIGVAVAAAVKAIKKSFMEDLETNRDWVEKLGMTGYLAKAVVYAIVGVLLIIAGFNADANKAGGLDVALKTLAAQPFGSVLLTVVALGFAAFGAYCFVAAKEHRS